MNIASSSIDAASVNVTSVFSCLLHCRPTSNVCLTRQWLKPLVWDLTCHWVTWCNIVVILNAYKASSQNCSYKSRCMAHSTALCYFYTAEIPAKFSPSKLRKHAHSNHIYSDIQQHFSITNAHPCTNHIDKDQRKVKNANIEPPTLSHTMSYTTQRFAVCSFSNTIINFILPGWNVIWLNCCFPIINSLFHVTMH